MFLQVPVDWIDWNRKARLRELAVGKFNLLRRLAIRHNPECLGVRSAKNSSSEFPEWCRI